MVTTLELSGDEELIRTLCVAVRKRTGKSFVINSNDGRAVLDAIEPRLLALLSADIPLRKLLLDVRNMFSCLMPSEMLNRLDARLADPLPPDPVSR